MAGARRHVAATGRTVICVTRFGLAARMRLLRCSARQLQKYIATMRQNRFLQWLFLYRGYSPADSTQRARSQSTRAGSSPRMEAPSGLKASYNSACGLRALLYADSSLATAYAAGLISTQTDIWCGTRGVASSAGSSSESDNAA